MPLTPTERRRHQSTTATERRPQHAVVIGAGLGGLTAAQALSRHFERVTLVERDDLPGRPSNRSGTPQSPPVDLLQPGCLAVLERLLPGIGAELVARGAGRPASRDLVEWVTRRLVMDTPQIIVRSGLEVTGLVVTEVAVPGTGGRVRAIDVRPRSAATPDPTESIVADLVVDARGRGSGVPEWLAAAGDGSPCLPEGFVVAGETMAGAADTAPRPAMGGAALAAEALDRSIGEHLIRHGDISGVSTRAQEAMARASGGAQSVENVEEER